MTEPEYNDDQLREKIKQEAGEIGWKELVLFFARGTAIAVSTKLDLVEVAMQFSKDNKTVVAQWMSDGAIVKVSDSQAQDWFETEAIVSAIVVKPWVVVQSLVSKNCSKVT